MKFIQLLLLLLLSLGQSILGHSHEGDNADRMSCLESEKQALLKFKDELIDTNGRLSSWGSEENKRDCCKWRGVKCNNKFNHVTRLDLHNPGDYDDATYAPLKGNISTALLELQHLQYLDLSFNDFDYVPIPEFIGSLSELRYLKLASAKFLGSIPSHLGNLSKLLHLDLSDNYNCYSKSLEWVSNLHSLKYLDLGSTNLSRANSWLQSVSKLASIKELLLRSCNLPSVLPPLLPSSINGSRHLSVLDLKWNWFLINSPNLTLLRWFSNSSRVLTSIHLNGNSMPGPIFPDVFENMISLKHLDLGRNELQGGIPKVFGNMSSLVHLDLSKNNLTGEFSALVMNLSGPIQEKLEYLDLSENSISGSFCNISRFSSLRDLNLTENQLNGTIRDGYLKLARLLELDLSRNKLTGPLPHDLSLCASLRKLNLDNNKFDGTFTETVHLSKLETLSIGLNFLEDIITEAFFSNLSRLQSLDLSANPSLIMKFSPHWVLPIQLRYLKLRHCGLGPHFPQWLKTQRQLIFIDISSTGILDNIPNWFGRIAPELMHLNASNNQLQGVFPDFFFSTSSIDRLVYTKTLDLSRNKISGSITFLCHATDWELLNLSFNMLFGQIPDCFTHFKRLKYLNLENNNFSGNILQVLNSQIVLNLLHLRNNSFSGELPISKENCYLSILDLGDNRLTGKIPTWIGHKCSRLQVLVLRFNEFYGTIPPNLCRLTNVQILDLSSNKFSGHIPNCLDKYSAMTRKANKNRMQIADEMKLLGYSLREIYQLQCAFFMWKGNGVKYINNLGLVKLIDLSSNNLDGEIPSEITKLIDLVGLNVSGNYLNGSIPTNIGELKSLEFLDFSRNHLSGNILTSLGQLSFLGSLNLSYNNLSGEIPATTQLMSFSESAYMGNSDLCGLPLNKSCNEDETHQDPNLNGEADDDEAFISEGFYIALGLGFVVGFWGIFGPILLNKAIRYAYLRMLNVFGDCVYVRAELTKARLLRYFQNR